MALLLSLCLVASTITVHALGTSWWVARLRHQAVRLAAAPGASTMLRVLVETGVVLIALHVLEVFFWALGYFWLPQVGLASFEEAMYFSFATFTTLGYGDITLQPPWRILTGIEALNGVFLIGWSTALSFAVIQTMLSTQVDLPRDAARSPAPEADGDEDASVG